jgi:hypothetical protein
MCDVQVPSCNLLIALIDYVLYDVKLLMKYWSLPLSMQRLLFR